MSQPARTPAPPRSAPVKPVLPARYRVKRELARGGMGVVYQAHDAEHDRDVAVKTLAPSASEDLVAFLRFDREARTVSSLHHPNICEVFEVSSYRGHPYIVMELLEGETVKARLARGQCDTVLALSVARQVAAGLAAAHDRSIIHRDIKPANVFITSGGVVKLLDFGIAKHFAGVESTGDVTVTQTGHTPGTVHYMAPEQLLGRRVDQRADLFSLGVLVYELLSGYRPFSGATTAEAMAAILHATPASLSPMPHVAEWNHVLDRLLGKDPIQRYATAAALLEDLSLFDRSMHGERVAWPRRMPVREAAPELSVAIVPFKAAHRRGDTDERKDEIEYFTYSLVDALTVGLSRFDGLRVVPRTLASTVTRRRTGPSRVGKQLHTDRLLIGTIARREDRFRAALSLYDVARDEVVWSREYDAAVEDLFHLRDQIINHLAAELRLVPAAAPRTHRAAAHNRQAFQLCLKGRFHWSRRYEDGLLKALECFREAIKLDPGLALAHAGLADTFSFLGFYSLMRPRTAFAAASTHANEALRIDSSLAEAHTSLGLVKLGGDWDWSAAVSEFKQAIVLDPTHALARVYLSWTHVLRDEISEAHAEVERAQDIDPLSPILNAGAAYTFFLSRSYERAIRECERALEIDKDFLVARYVMALCKGQLGLHEDAIRDLEHAVTLSGEMVFYMTLLGKMYADTGRKPMIAKARRILQRFDEMRDSGRYVGPHAWVYVYAGLGDLDRAFEWQTKAFEDGAPPFNHLSPQLGRLHADPRFLQELLVWNANLSVTQIRTVLGPQAAVAGPGQPA